MRKSIDNIDDAIVAMFAERIKDLALEYGLDSEFAHSYLRSMIDRVVERHTALTDQS